MILSKRSQSDSLCGWGAHTHCLASMSICLDTFRKNGHTEHWRKPVPTLSRPLAQSGHRSVSSSSSSSSPAQAFKKCTSTNKADYCTVGNHCKFGNDVAWMERVYIFADRTNDLRVVLVLDKDDRRQRWMPRRDYNNTKFNKHTVIEWCWQIECVCLDDYTLYEARGEGHTHRSSSMCAWDDVRWWWW